MLTHYKPSKKVIQILHNSVTKTDEKTSGFYKTDTTVVHF